MNRIIFGVVGTAFLATVAAIAVARVSHAEPATSPADPGVYTVIYNVADLPVWCVAAKEPQFDPSVVMALLEASVAPESWDPGPGSICASAEHKSIVVSQNRANHEKVVDVLRSLRAAQAPARQPAAKATPDVTGR
ncbi:MAG TPA: hypothetical protein VMF30_15930 [Pirellulales bacterium]|nr:hypothetical protein [Pirellulales bacterium]